MHLGGRYVLVPRLRSRRVQSTSASYRCPFIEAATPAMAGRLARGSRYLAMKVGEESAERMLGVGSAACTYAHSLL
jgi:hypothetical protein